MQEDCDLEDIPLIWDESFACEDVLRDENQKDVIGRRQFEGILSDPGRISGWMEDVDRNNNIKELGVDNSYTPRKKRRLASSKSDEIDVEIGNRSVSKDVQGRPVRLRRKLNGCLSMKQDRDSAVGMPKLDASNRELNNRELMTESRTSCRGVSHPPTLSPEAPVMSPATPAIKDSRDVSGNHLQEYYDDQTDTIILERYYFGELHGKPRTTPDPYKVLKCSMCAKCFTSNTEIYGHLYSHAAGTSKRTCGQNWCPYCLEPGTPMLLKLHIKTAHHMVRNNRFTCQICEETFKGEFDLTVHMWENHCQLDMPYCCHLCDYRSSIRFQVIDHFHKAHVPSPFVQCPVCLKVLRAASEQDLSEILAHAQLHHVVKGQKCKHCALVFTGRNELNSHYRSGAHTCKQWDNVKREISPYKNLFRIKRLRIPKPPPSVNDASVGLKAKAHRVYSQISELSLKMQVGQETCLECGQQLNSADHFLGVMTCAKCNYNTCCQNAMFMHYDTTHRYRKRYLGMPRLHLKTCALLETKHRCDCGYNTSHPNRLARHLALCNKARVFF